MRQDARSHSLLRFAFWNIDLLAIEENGRDLRSENQKFAREEYRNSLAVIGECEHSHPGFYARGKSSCNAQLAHRFSFFTKGGHTQ